MANTVNFTGSVDRELLKRAKVIAAKTDTSINALFNAELRHLVDFSLGRMDGRKATAALGIESDEDLFLLMAQAHLPMPRLSESTTRGMIDTLHALPNQS